MKTNLLETKTVSFREIIGNGKKYSVPLYQRDYSWKAEQWEDLWLDIESLKENNEVHYMGSIVLKGDGDKSYTIIDGQQRFITISIIILAAIQRIEDLIKENPASDEASRNTDRKKILMDTFLGNKDAVSLTYASKLTLNSHNNDFYQSKLLQLNILSTSSKTNDSNKLMHQAFQYYYEAIKKSSDLDSGENLSRFIESTLGDRILFIQIAVENEISAYTVFETLNARGLELTATDLLKNYLFSLVKSSTDIENLNRQWESIVNTVGVDKLPRFLRYYLNSKQALIRTERLFKEIKNQIVRREQVLPLLSDMEKYGDLFSAISDPDSDLWKTNKDVKSLIQEIKLFNAEQHKSLVMASYFHLETNEFTKLLRIVKALVFRYTVISGLNPNDLEKVYNKAAIKISKKEIVKASDIFKELQPVYINDEDFISYFSTKVIAVNSRTKKLIRYILMSIEKQKHNVNYSPLDSDVTIEHILPQNPADEWEKHFDSKKQDEMINRLGNLTLLEDSLNAKDAGNKPFSKKKEFYAQSQFGITKDLSKIENWNMDTLRSRQNDLAKTAASVWKADY